jgi:putative flippase GtrA
VYWAVFAVNVAVLPVLVNGLHWSPLAAQAVFTAVAVVAGYLAHSRFSFAAAASDPEPRFPRI